MGTYWAIWGYWNCVSVVNIGFASVRDFLGLRECGEEKEGGGPFTFSQFSAVVAGAAGQSVMYDSVSVKFFTGLEVRPLIFNHQKTIKSSIVVYVVSGWDGRTDGRTKVVKSCNKGEEKQSGDCGNFFFPNFVGEKNSSTYRDIQTVRLNMYDSIILLIFCIEYV